MHGTLDALLILMMNGAETIILSINAPCYYASLRHKITIKIDDILNINFVVFCQAILCSKVGRIKDRRRWILGQCHGTIFKISEGECII